MISKDTPYILNRLDESTAEMLIYDMIGESWFEEGLTAKRVANDLKELGNVKLLNVHINSQGGSVFHGVAIYNALRRFSNDTRKVHTYIDGAAFSIASVIAMAGDRVFMADNALLMIHDPWALANGNANELRRLADLLDKSKAQIIRAYTRKTSESSESIAAMMSDETYLDADEALNYGFVDEVLGEIAIAALSQPLDSSHVPAHLRAQFESFFNLSTITESESMSESTDNARTAGAETLPVVATIQQLESMPGSDASWVLEQLKASATLEQAQASLMQKLFEENQQLRTAPPQASVPRVHQPEDQTSFGVAPLTSETAGVEPQAKSKTVDAHAEYRRIVRDYVRNGMPLAQASQEFSREYPHLAEELCPTPPTLSRRA